MPFLLLCGCVGVWVWVCLDVGIGQIDRHKERMSKKKEKVCQKITCPTVRLPHFPTGPSSVPCQYKKDTVFVCSFSLSLRSSTPIPFSSPSSPPLLKQRCALHCSWLLPPSSSHPSLPTRAPTTLPPAALPPPLPSAWPPPLTPPAPPTSSPTPL